ncbi:MAG: alpha/beta hydrolase [Pseudomonadota bacterium]
MGSEQAVTAGAALSRSWYETMDDGAQLRVSLFAAVNAERQGTILLLHGFGEFTEKYLPTIMRLGAMGFTVLTLDWRSQGLSSRFPESQRRGYVRDFDRLLDDVDALLASPIAAELPAPYRLLGHSMGGMLALRLLEPGRPQPLPWSAAILSAPMLGIYRLPRWFVRSVAQLQIWRGKAQDFAWGSGPLDPDHNENRITTDADRFQVIMQLLRDNPQLATHGATWAWLNAAAKLMRGSVRKRRLRRLDVPILLLSPGQDVIVDADLHHRFAARYRGCELVKLPDSMHEPLQETAAIQDEVYAVIARFVSEQPR